MRHRPHADELLALFQREVLGVVDGHHGAKGRHGDGSPHHRVSALDLEVASRRWLQDGDRLAEGGPPASSSVHPGPVDPVIGEITYFFEASLLTK